MAAPPPNQALIRVRNLSQRYRSVQALSAVSFEVAEGEIFGLIGADGAGKSTTLLALAGLLRSEGSVEVAGCDVLASPERVRPLIGFMPQGLGQNLSPELSVEENIGFFADLHGAPRGEEGARREALLSATRLSAFRDRQAKHLSGGMKQKLALCCTLISQPRLLILDEPTTGVDPVSRREFWTILEQVRAQGITVVLATAYMDEADRCDRVGLLHEGRLLSAGPPAELRAKVPGALIELEAAPQAEAVRLLSGAGFFPEVMGESVRFVAGEAERLRALEMLAAGGVEVAAERGLEPSFEHAFIYAIASQATGSSRPVAPLGRPEPPETAPSEPEGGPPVVVEGLVKRFGEFAAVEGVGFEVRRGEIFGLLGSNGAGKTTTIKILCGLAAPTSGTVRVLGHEPLREPLRLKARMGYVSQRFSLYRDLTVRENLALYGGMYGLGRRELAERAEWAVRLAGLTGKEGVLTEELPLGMKQRLALGCAVIHAPRLLFLDEPTAGVDPLARRAFWGLIHHLSREQGVTVLVTTHYMDEAGHCDRIGLIHAGRLVALGSPAQLKARVSSARGRLVAVRCHRPAAAIEAVRAFFPEAHLCGRRLEFWSLEPEADVARVASLLGADFEGAEGVAVGLDDVFVHFIQAAEGATAPRQEAACAGGLG
jgi:ABC-2 type transport system ATP-binding protein